MISIFKSKKTGLKTAELNSDNSAHPEINKTMVHE